MLKLHKFEGVFFAPKSRFTPIYKRLCFQMVATGNGDFLEYYIYLTRGWGPNMVGAIYRRTNEPAANFKMKMKWNVYSNRGYRSES